MNRPYGSYEGAAFVPAFLCGIPRITAEGGFYPADFGGAHPSDPRLQVKFYAYYFGDTALREREQGKR